MKLNINTTLLNTLYVLLDQGENDKALSILRNIRQYQYLRLQAKDSYSRGDKTQYRAFNEQIEAFVKDKDLSSFMD